VRLQVPPTGGRPHASARSMARPAHLRRHGADTDIIVASAKAYLAALNRCCVAIGPNVRRRGRIRRQWPTEPTPQVERPKMTMTTSHEPCSRRSGTITWSRRSRRRPAVLYIDLHLIHEVTSPQAFTGLRERGCGSAARSAPWRPWTTPRRPTGRVWRSSTPWPPGPARPAGATAPSSAFASTTWRAPQQRHRARHRAGAGAHAAGHDHRLRRQPHLDPRRLRRAGLRHRHQRGGARARHPVPAAVPAQDLRGRGRRPLQPGVTAKDIILALIAQIGTGGGTGHVFEYAGSAIRALSMEERMTVCNMSIEAAPGPA
jgi:hypothetical protein